MVYCYEKFGVVYGLIWVCGLIMDDVYIFCICDQMCDELWLLLWFVFDLFVDYGFIDFYFELFIKDLEKFVGVEEVWEEVIIVLVEVGVEFGLELVFDLGGVVFYGFKILVQVKDVLGCIWQMLIIQLDFNFLECFGLEYIVVDGICYCLVMIYCVLFGLIEWFFGIFIEYYVGVFLVWLVFVQVVGILVVDEYVVYLEEVVM